ncbi:GNAT family N-acetyltransferase [Indiicoccus explosivorum]|uniref:GNAT family N-acetyltransferase n=1 Tax=Indiicoccus explosivorum TaxID=1917864 RepID=UPI000B43E610|nr:GNAT family N-acetyltransferase [Indiicoccus explosivorum]
MTTIRITADSPADFGAVHALYEALDWNSLGLTTADLERMCRQSWHVLYAYEGDRLVGTGRIISDGVITGVICGVGVHPAFQKRGIGKQLMRRLIDQCESNGVIAQLMCVESLESYYETLGFKKFSIGMYREPKNR